MEFSKYPRISKEYPEIRIMGEGGREGGGKERGKDERNEGRKEERRRKEGRKEGRREGKREGEGSYIVCQHKSSSFNDKLMALLVLHHGSSQTSCTTRLPRRVDCPGAEFLHLPSDVMMM